jgi:hypothetical protein
LVLKKFKHQGQNMYCQKSSPLTVRLCFTVFISCTQNSASDNYYIVPFFGKKRYSNKKAFEKVKRKIMCKDFEDGGLKMINVTDMQNSF